MTVALSDRVIANLSAGVARLMSSSCTRRAPMSSCCGLAMRHPTFRHHPLPIGVPADIGLDDRRLTAGRIDLGQHLVRRRPVGVVVHHDRKALLRQTQRDRPADAARGAGDQGDGLLGSAHDYFAVSAIFW